MRDRRIVSIVIIVVMLFAAAPQVEQVQAQGGACEALLEQAFSDLGTNCAGLGPNGICRGFPGVSVTMADGSEPPADFFDEPEDFTAIESVSTSGFSTERSEWGLAAIRVPAREGLTAIEDNVALLLMGEAELVNRGYKDGSPMFDLSTGADSTECFSVPPSSLMVQSPNNMPVTITINDVPIEVRSTIFVRAPADGELELITGNGAATLFPGLPNQVVIPAGVSVDVVVGLDIAFWQNWRVRLQGWWDRFEILENIPLNIFIVIYFNPAIIQPSPTDGTEPQVQLPTGITRPVTPIGIPFPLIVMRTGIMGEALDRVSWEPITLGGRVCPAWTLFHSNRTENWDILRLNLGEGGELINITDESEEADIAPTFSPDGEWVAYISNRDPMGSWEIYLARTDGTGQARRVTFNTATELNPVWSPGSQIVFESNRDGNWDLYLFDVASAAEPVRLTEDPGSDLGAFWFPDGERIVFESNRDGDWEIYELNVTTGELTQLTDNDTGDYLPTISNDGTKMAWLRADADGVDNLWLRDFTTGQSVQMTDTGTSVNGQIFSPDDTLIAYHARDAQDGDFEVYTIGVDTGQITAVTNNDVDDSSPTFYCETSAIIFQSVVREAPDEPGQYELFITDPLSVGGASVPTRLTNAPNADDIYAENEPRSEANTRPALIIPGPLE